MGLAEITDRVRHYSIHLDRGYITVNGYDLFTVHTDARRIITDIQRAYRSKAKIHFTIYTPYHPNKVHHHRTYILDYRPTLPVAYRMEVEDEVSGRLYFKY